MRRKLVGDRSEPAAFRHLAENLRGFGSRIGFRFVDGGMKSLPYSHLVETAFDPTAGIILEFVGHRVTITGRNLVALYDALEDEEVGEIVEQHANDMSLAEGDLYVARITWEKV